jgi:hypothetical protein
MQIIAIIVNATAKHERNPSDVGDVFPVLTNKLTITKMKVQQISIKNAFRLDINGSFGNSSKISEYGIPLLDTETPAKPSLLYKESHTRTIPNIPPKI